MNNPLSEIDIDAACIEGDLSKVQELCSGPMGSAIRDKEDGYPIMSAVKHAHLDIVKFLLEQAGNINANNNSQKRTALHFASEEGVLPIVQWLLENDANVNCADVSDKMPIHLAYQIKDQTKKLDIIQLLLKHGADATATAPVRGFSDVESVLADSFKCGNLDLVKLFTEYKCDFYKSYLKYKYNTPLLLAVIERRQELLQYLIDIGIDLKDRYKIGFDCLAAACTTDNLDFIEFVCEAVYNNQLSDETKSRAIHTAAMESDREVLEFLLEMGCNVDARNYYMETPIMSAIVGSRPSNFDYLVDYQRANKYFRRYDGKNVAHLSAKYTEDSSILWGHAGYLIKLRDAVDFEQLTPLHYAIMGGSVVNIKNLIDLTDLNVTDFKEKTFLHYYCNADKEAWNHKIAETLINRVNIEAVDEENRTALHIAAENESVVYLAFLIANGANITAVSNDKGTALHHALANSRRQNVQLLLQLNAHYNIPNREGKTPLHYATYCSPTVKKLLEKGANVRAVDKDGLTPLHYACQYHYMALSHEERYRPEEQTSVYFFIRRGADINARDKWGRTPLHLAYKNQSNYLNILLSHGADRDAVDYEGKTILHYAAQGDYMSESDFPLGETLNIPDKNGHRPLFYASNTENLKFLIDHTDNIKPDEFRNYFPQLSLDIDGLKMVFERGASVEAVDENGNTMLHKYLREGYDEKVEFLLERGADINARNNNMATPMHIATMAGHYECLKMLTDRGGDLGAKDIDCKTPLDYARNGDCGAYFAEVLNYLTV